MFLLSHSLGSVVLLVVRVVVVLVFVVLVEVVLVKDVLVVEVCRCGINGWWLGFILVTIVVGWGISGW